MRLQEFPTLTRFKKNRLRNTKPVETDRLRIPVWTSCRSRRKDAPSIRRWNHFRCRRRRSERWGNLSRHEEKAYSISWWGNLVEEKRGQRYQPNVEFRRQQECKRVNENDATDLEDRCIDRLIFGCDPRPNPQFLSQSCNALCKETRRRCGFTG